MIVSSWPDYASNQIVAVTDSGAVYVLPVVTDTTDVRGRAKAFSSKWIRVVDSITETA